MLFRTHFVFGLFVWFILERFVEMPFFVLGFVLLGSVFVDIDSFKSKVGRRVWIFSWFLRHRGFFHSFVGAVFLSLVVDIFNRWAGFGFFVGYISHLFLDCFTKMGVALFWPFDFKIRGLVRSGSWLEDVVFVLLLLSDVWLVFEKLF